MSKDSLFRDPAEWATDWGWISRRRAVNLAAKINGLAEVMEDTGADEALWAQELRKIAKTLAPAKVPAQLKHARMARDEAAALREP